MFKLKFVDDLLQYVYLMENVKGFVVIQEKKINYKFEVNRRY